MNAPHILTWAKFPKLRQLKYYFAEKIGYIFYLFTDHPYRNCHKWSGLIIISPHVLLSYIKSFIWVESEFQSVCACVVYACACAWPPGHHLNKILHNDVKPSSPSSQPDNFMNDFLESFFVSYLSFSTDGRFFPEIEARPKILKSPGRHSGEISPVRVVHQREKESKFFSFKISGPLAKYICVRSRYTWRLHVWERFTGDTSSTYVPWRN